MYLIQLLLPLFDKAGKAQPRAAFVEVEDALVERFGGVTTYARAPAHGKWRSGEGAVEGDDIAVFEVMTRGLSRAWWKRYRAALMRKFGQDDIVVRATRMQTL